MGYHHKHEECSKDTHEILQNVLVVKCREYDLIASTQTIEVSSPTDEIVDSTTNILTSDAEKILEAEEPTTASTKQVVTSDEDGVGTEYYKAPLDITFKIDEIESYIKERKHSNKINTDINYSTN